MSERTDDPLRLLGLDAVASILGTDRENVRRLIDTGRLPCIRVGARGEPRVSLRMLDAWQATIASQTTGQTSARQGSARPAKPRLKEVS